MSFPFGDGLFSGAPISYKIQKGQSGFKPPGNPNPPKLKRALGLGIRVNMYERTMKRRGSENRVHLRNYEMIKTIALLIGSDFSKVLARNDHHPPNVVL